MLANFFLCVVTWFTKKAIGWLNRGCLKQVYNNTTGFSYLHSFALCLLFGPQGFLICTSAYLCTGWKALFYLKKVEALLLIHSSYCVNCSSKFYLAFVQLEELGQIKTEQNGKLNTLQFHVCECTSRFSHLIKLFSMNVSKFTYLLVP